MISKQLEIGGTVSEEYEIAVDLIQREAGRHLTNLYQLPEDSYERKLEERNVRTLFAIADSLAPESPDLIHAVIGLYDVLRPANPADAPETITSDDSMRAVGVR